MYRCRWKMMGPAAGNLRTVARVKHAISSNLAVQLLDAHPAELRAEVYTEEETCVFTAVLFKTAHRLEINNQTCHTHSRTLFSY